MKASTLQQQLFERERLLEQLQMKVQELEERKRRFAESEDSPLRSLKTHGSAKRHRSASKITEEAMETEERGNDTAQEQESTVLQQRGLDEVESDIVEIRAMAQQLYATLAEEEVRRLEIEEHLRIAVTQLEEREAALQGLNVELQKSTMELMETQEEMIRAKEEAFQSQKARDEALTEARELKERVEANELLLLEKTKAANDRFLALNAELDQSRREIAVLDTAAQTQEELAKLQVKISAREQELEEMKTALEAWKQIKGSLETEVNLQTTTIDELRQELVAASERESETRHQLEQRQATLSTMEDQLSALDAERILAQQHCDYAQQQLQSSQTQLGAAKREIEDLQQQMADKDNVLQVRDQALSELEEKVLALSSAATAMSCAAPSAAENLQKVEIDQLRQALGEAKRLSEEKDGIIFQTNEALKSLEAELERLQSLHDIEVRFSEVQQQLSQVQQQHSAASTELESNKMLIAQLESKIVELQTDKLKSDAILAMAAPASSILTASSATSPIKLSFASAATSPMVLEKEEDEEDSEVIINSNYGEIVRLTEALTERQGKIEQLQEYLQLAQSSCNSVHEQMEKLKAQQHEALEQQTADFQANLAILKANIEEARENETRARAEAQLAVEHLHQEIGTQKSRAQELQDQVQILEAQIQDLQSQRNLDSSEQATAAIAIKQSLEEAHTLLQLKEKEMAEKLGMIHYLEEKLEEMQLQHQELQSQQEKSHTQHEDLKLKLVNIEQALRKAQREAIDEKEANKQLQASVQDLSDQIDRLEHLRDVAQKLQRTETALSEVTSAMDDKTKQLQARLEAVESLNGQLTLARSQIQMQEELITEMQQQLQASKADVITLEEKLRMSSSAQETLKREMQARLDNQLKEIEQRHQLVYDLQSRLRDAEEQLELQSSMLNEAQAHHKAELQEARKASNEELRRALDDAATLQSKTQDLQSVLHSTQNEVKRLSGLKEDLAKVQKKLKASQADVKALEDARGIEVQELRTLIDELQDNVKRLEDERREERPELHRACRDQQISLTQELAALREQAAKDSISLAHAQAALAQAQQMARKAEMGIVESDALYHLKANLQRKEVRRGSIFNFSFTQTHTYI